MMVLRLPACSTLSTVLADPRHWRVISLHRTKTLPSTTSTGTPTTGTPTTVIGAWVFTRRFLKGEDKHKTPRTNRIQHTSYIKIPYLGKKQKKYVENSLKTAKEDVLAYLTHMRKPNSKKENKDGICSKYFHNYSYVPEKKEKNKNERLSACSFRAMPQ